MEKSVDVACSRTRRKNTIALCGHNVGIWGVGVGDSGDASWL